VTSKTLTFRPSILLFFLLIVQKEPVSHVRQRIQAKLDIPEKEFEKVWHHLLFFPVILLWHCWLFYSYSFYHPKLDMHQ